MNYGYIYLITNLVNGKGYVGQTRRNVSQRWNEEIDNHSNQTIGYAIAKYGVDNFKFEVLEKFPYDTPFFEQVLTDAEHYYMCALNTHVSEWGYNVKIPSDSPLWKYTVSKGGTDSYNGKQKYTIKDRNDKQIITSIDKDKLDNLVIKLNNNEITEEDIYKSKEFKYTVSKKGFYNGKQKYAIKDKNGNPIIQSIDKPLLDDLVIKLNNGEIIENDIYKSKEFKYTVAKAGFNRHGKQNYTIKDKNRRDIIKSINKCFLDTLCNMLNNEDITEDYIKSNGGMKLKKILKMRC